MSADVRAAVSAALKQGYCVLYSSVSNLSYMQWWFTIAAREGDVVGHEEEGQKRNAAPTRNGSHWACWVLRGT